MIDADRGSSPRRSITGRLLLSIVAGAVAVLCAACGGDEESTAVDVGEGSSCLESFTGSAPETLPRLARLSHAQGSPVLVGSYAGPPFSAETYDEGTEGDGSRVEVAEGACVVTEVSPDFGPLYVFVEADDGAWHRLLESDPRVPLVPEPESKLEDVERVEIEQIGA